jgi:hypothetical protein
VYTKLPQCTPSSRWVNTYAKPNFHVIVKLLHAHVGNSAASSKAVSDFYCFYSVIIVIFIFLVFFLSRYEADFGHCRLKAAVSA